MEIKLISLTAAIVSIRDFDVTSVLADVVTFHLE